MRVPSLLIGGSCSVVVITRNVTDSIDMFTRVRDYDISNFDLSTKHPELPSYIFWIVHVVYGFCQP